jgi:hypothetical protein
VKWLVAICALDHLNALTLLVPATTTAVKRRSSVSFSLAVSGLKRARSPRRARAVETGCDSNFWRLFGDVGHQIWLS